MIKEFHTFLWIIHFQVQCAVTALLKTGLETSGYLVGDSVSQACSYNCVSDLLVTVVWTRPYNGRINQTSSQTFKGLHLTGDPSVLTGMQSDP